MPMYQVGSRTGTAPHEGRFVPILMAAKHRITRYFQKDPKTQADFDALAKAQAKRERKAAKAQRDAERSAAHYHPALRYALAE